MSPAILARLTGEVDDVAVRFKFRAVRGKPNGQYWGIRDYL